MRQKLCARHLLDNLTIVNYKDITEEKERRVLDDKLFNIVRWL